MATTALPTTLIARLRDPAAVRRGLVYGVTWGVSLTAALTAIAAWQCGGVICLDEAAWLAGVSTATGILAIGPIALLGPRAQE